MVCIAGGPAWMGSDDHRENEKPKRKIIVGTFYIDRKEVTNGEYKLCEDAGACDKAYKHYEGFNAPDQPTVPMTWHKANAYCAWVGKRLPTEAEWEKAARGPDGNIYPWGNDAPTCEKAHFKGCKPEVTKPPGSFAPGAYGLFDMAGNGYEWVQDWSSECVEGCRNPCGDACRGTDPMGPCSGASFCNGVYRRILKGGSWYWPAEEIRGSWRRPEMQDSGLHRLSFRCATSHAFHSKPPARIVSEPMAELNIPEAPSEADVRIATEVTDDEDILKIPPCANVTTASETCRDPVSYLTTNEISQQAWYPYIANLGGAYLGLGSDQSYNLITSAKSRWAWIFDYDPGVVRVHYVLRALIPEAASPAELVSLYASENKEKALALIRSSSATYKLSTTEQKETEQNYLRTRDFLYKHYKKSAAPREDATVRPDPKGVLFGWLRNDKHYQYIRTLFKQGRIRIVKGNLLNDKALPSITKAIRQLRIPLRVFYVSNADEMWTLKPQYRANVIGMPFDEWSVLLRTVSPKKYQRKQYSYWHYVVAGGYYAQRQMKRTGVTHVWDWMEDRVPTETDFLSALGMPGKTEKEP